MELPTSPPTSITETDSFMHSERASSSAVVQTNEQTLSDSSNPRIHILPNSSSSGDSWMKGWQRYDVEPVKLRSNISPRKHWKLQITDWSSTRYIFNQLKTPK